LLSRIHETHLKGGLLPCKLQLFIGYSVKGFVKHYSIAEIQGWSRIYRANFVNSLSGFKPVSLIASINKEGQPNLGIFSNIIHLGADPALIGFINRPKEAAPHTINNIEATGFYTINHILPEFVDKAHQTSAKYPENVNEFDAVGLTALQKDGFFVPYVAESHVQMGLYLSEIIPLSNGTFLVVGALEHAYVNESAVAQDGFIELAKEASVVSLGLDAYYTTSPLHRYTYAKPEQSLTEVPF
jgi:flavin reductase (DIM6/NTAB) family NADH-FMN oxidoreductase RutF